jgi:hypothetical protein
MSNQLEIINKSVNEIREILNAKDAAIYELPDMVKALSEKAANSGFTTAFIFSTESNPIVPTGGSLDATTGLVTNIEEG